MNCDICHTLEETLEAEGKTLIYGRWICYCSDCLEAGKARDNQLTFDNEIAPDIDSGDFSYTQNNGLSDILLDCMM